MLQSSKTISLTRDGRSNLFHIYGPLRSRLKSGQREETHPLMQTRTLIAGSPPPWLSGAGVTHTGGTGMARTSSLLAAEFLNWSS